MKKVIECLEESIKWVSTDITRQKKILKDKDIELQMLRERIETNETYVSNCELAIGAIRGLDNTKLYGALYKKEENE